MQNIVLLSDTHSYIDQAILKHCKNADAVWHAGDIGSIAVLDQIRSVQKNIQCVYGNIDGQEHRSVLQEDLLFQCEQVKVYMTHIGGYPPKYNKRTKAILMKEKPKLFICGHSHILKVMYDKSNDILHMNPGACGVSGFHQVRTLLKFSIDKDTIKDLQVIEWQKSVRK